MHPAILSRELMRASVTKKLPTPRSMKNLWLKYKKYGWWVVAFYAIKGMVYIAIVVWAWLTIS
jgi:hypothetical protein